MAVRQSQLHCRFPWALADGQKQLNGLVKEYQTKYNTFQEKYEQERREHDSIKRKYTSLLDNTKGEKELERRLKEVEGEAARFKGEAERLKGFERRAQGLAIELEEEKRKAAQGQVVEHRDSTQATIDPTVKEELKRESPF
jgi:mitotic spindle assembly checkpoint protein MAD1